MSALMPFSFGAPEKSRTGGPTRYLPWLALRLGASVSLPFILLFLRSQVSTILFPQIYLWLRLFVAHPDRPDRTSLQSASDKPKTSYKKAVLDERGKPFGPLNFKNILQQFLSSLFSLSTTLLLKQRVPLAVELSPEIEEELLRRSNIHYQALLRHNSELDLSRAPRTLGVMAIRAAFHDFNLDPDHSMVDIFELADEISNSRRASTSTPESTEFPPHPEGIMADTNDTDQQQIEVGVEVTTNGSLLGDELVLPPVSPEDWLAFLNSQQELSRRGNHLEARNRRQDSGNTISPQPLLADPVPHEQPFQPAVTLETLIDPPTSEARDPSESRNSIHRQLSGPIPPSLPPPSPVPGISRAASLPLAPRPVRRPTLSDQRLPRTFGEEVNRRQRERNWNSTQDPDANVYRVTILSNHAASAIAYHAASLIESVVLLPLDVLFLRSLTRNFLANQSETQYMTQATTLLGGVWPLSMAEQMRDLSIQQELQFWGNYLLTISMQTLANLTIWAVGTRVTLRLGERFGWGCI